MLAIVLTAGLVYSGADWHYFLLVRPIYVFFFSAAIIGGLVPILLPLALLLYGYARRTRAVVTLGAALAQAALLGSLVSSVYKAFTGRLQPNLHDYAHDLSHGFQFGLWRHGVFWGWPSSHTTIAFSMAVALVTLRPSNRTLTVLALLYALFIGVGVSMSIHWLSDAVAGAIIGTVVGRVVGTSFRSPSESAG